MFGKHAECDVSSSDIPHCMILEFQYYFSPYLLLKLAKSDNTERKHLRDSCSYAAQAATATSSHRSNVQPANSSTDISDIPINGSSKSQSPLIARTNGNIYTRVTRKTGSLLKIKRRDRENRTIKPNKQTNKQKPPHHCVILNPPNKCAIAEVGRLWCETDRHLPLPRLCRCAGQQHEKVFSFPSSPPPPSPPPPPCGCVPSNVRTAPLGACVGTHHQIHVI